MYSTVEEIKTFRDFLTFSELEYHDHCKCDLSQSTIVSEEFLSDSDKIMIRTDDRSGKTRTCSKGAIIIIIDSIQSLSIIDSLLLAFFLF